jgi:ferritin-like metal-binding protein YciE
MADTKIEQKLVDDTQDMHALERNVKRMLESMITTQKNDAILQDLRHHLEETDDHISLVEGRLKAHGETRSARKDIQALGGALAKTVVDVVRGDKEGKNLRDAYVTEHAEIAGYQLLERLADRAGDEATAQVARNIRAQEVAMADRLDKHWELVIDQTLTDNDIEVPA